ncbi:MAG: hypothetical protein ABIG61_06785 [Planctomycetota bacterium]
MKYTAAFFSALLMLAPAICTASVGENFSIGVYYSMPWVATGDNFSQ